MELSHDNGRRVASALERAADDVSATVLSNTSVNPEYKHLVLAAPEPAPSAAAGQFFNLECPITDSDKPFLRRPMSVYKADPNSGEVEFLYKITGAGTRGLARLRAGDTMRILGPLGLGFQLDPTCREIVVVGRGVGLATLAPLAELAATQSIAVTAVFSARGPDYVMSVDRFAACGARVEVVLDSDRSSDVERVEALMRGLIASQRVDSMFTCGSNRLMLLLQRLGREFGIAGQVAMEQQMACGLGMCFCCVRSFRAGEETVSRRVCWEGPVFDLQEALSW